MRFHIGFSKRISIKTLIEIIGFLFVGLVTFFGFYDTTHAEVIWGYFNDQSSNINPYEYTYLDYNDNFALKTKNDLKSYKHDGTIYISSVANSSQYSNWYHFNYAFTDYSRTNLALIPYYSHTANEIFQSLSYKFDPPFSICENTTEDFKSVNFQLTLYNSFGRNNIEQFNQTFESLEQFSNDISNVKIKSHTLLNNSDFYITTSCSLNKVYNSFYYVYDCNNVFNGTSKYPVDYYLIEIGNNLPFNDLYINTQNEGYIEGLNYFYAPSSSSNGDNTPFRYSCSDSPPNITATSSIGDDPAGFDDIYDRIKDYYSVDLPGINKNNFVDIPSNFSEFLLLPMYIVNSVIQNSSGTCESYSLDLSSIVSKWGNENEHYYIELPCMRNVLSNKLGTLYNLCDILICFILFYNIAMHIIRLIDALTYGEDLLSIFYVPTGVENTVLVATHEGTYTRPKGTFE